MIGFEKPGVLLLLLLAIVPLFNIFQASEKYKKILSASRTLLIAILVVAAASPFITTQEPISEKPRITVLNDNSRSTKILGEPELKFEEVNVEEKIIATGNSSDLENSLSRNLEKNTAYLALTDFQSSTSLENVAEKFRKANSSLNLLKTEAEKEVSVRISGPESTVPGASNRFKVTVDSTGKIPVPKVVLDGKPVELEKQSENTWSFTRTFDSTGSHSIAASVKVEDRFPANNRFYHIVEVEEKPKILVVGEEQGLKSELEEFYRVEYRRNLPSDLSSYYTVILKKSVDRSMIPYVSRGNGVVYTGNYKPMMDILPVKRADADARTEATQTMLAIDNSRELGGKKGRTRSIKISTAVINGLSKNNKVGLVFYNSTSGVPVTGNAGKLTEPVPLSRNREDLKNRIAGLEPGGLAFHNAGLKLSETLLGDNGNIILITDGALPTGAKTSSFKDTYGYTIQQKSFDLASQMNSELIVIGVDPEQNPFTPGGENFLKELRDRSGGQYYRARDLIDPESGTVPELVGGGGSAENIPINVVNSDHFITQGLRTQSFTNSFDPVKPRRGSRELVKMANGNPFLTTWRYGLGRVAAFSGDDSTLSSVRSVDPRLFTRSVSWTVGDPQRKKDKWMKAESSRRPNKVKVKASYNADGLKRQGENLYTAEISPNSTGFHSVEGERYAYNYNEEIQGIGYSEKAEKIVESTGGEVYNKSEMDQLLKNIKQFSDRKVQRKKPLTTYLLLAALILFLAEVGYRKMNGKK